MAKIYARALRDVAKELDSALRKFNKMNSAHEGYAVILEEVIELRAEVFKKQRKRKPAKMQREAIQIAAKAIRFVMDCT